jgi:2,5-diketo-D-gluconate reductase A
MKTTEIPELKLNDGREIPQLGFGVFLVPPDEAAAAVAHALKTGYRSIDTAAAYRNEHGVGEAIRVSGVGRDNVYVTTKLWNDDQGRESARGAFEKSLERLGDDYVDLYLIHWPAPPRNTYLETWETLCELKQEGTARSIGVSNFRVEDLERIIDATGVVPAVNQIELHPRFQQSELRAYHDEHGIKTESWSPLGRGAALEDETIRRIASGHDHTPAQVILRWHLQLGLIVIPKSVTPARIEENFGVFDFELSDAEISAIAELDSPDGRIGPDPAEFVSPGN